MSRSRPDYQSFIEWLNILNDENDPITILARSGGERETDTLAVFPCLEVDEQGQYHLYFFSHGLRHLPSSAIERINQLESGEKLWLAHEFQNLYDSQALILNTEQESKTKNDYLREMITEVLNWGLQPKTVTTDSWYSYPPANAVPPRQRGDYRGVL